MDSSAKGILLSIISIGIGLISYISPVYRWTIIGVFLILVVLFYITELDKTINNCVINIKKLNEKIKIYQELSFLKARIEELEKNGMRK